MDDSPYVAPRWKLIMLFPILVLAVLGWLFLNFSALYAITFSPGLAPTLQEKVAVAIMLVLQIAVLRIKVVRKAILEMVNDYRRIFR